MIARLTRAFATIPRPCNLRAPQCNSTAGALCRRDRLGILAASANHRNPTDGKARTMNVTITENPALDDIEVSVACPRIDERVQRIVASLGAYDRTLTGERDGAVHRIDRDEVCYAETVDGRTFLYTADAVYRTPLKLYELEDKLAGTEFVRASKQMLVNFDHVASIRPALNARLQLMLDNDEAVIVSRQYAPAIKHKLGL